MQNFYFSHILENVDRCFLHPQGYLISYTMQNDADSECNKEYLRAWK